MTGDPRQVGPEAEEERVLEGIAGQARRGPGVALLLAAGLLLLVGLGWTDVSAPDEPRYLQVAEEMRALEHGPRGLLLLHLNGEPYTQKPPLYYGLAALFGSPFGRVDETTARLPSALAGIATVAVTALLGTRMLGPAAGLLGAALLLTTLEFSTLARRIQLDVLLALFETLALATFWQVDRKRLSARAGALLFHVFLALGVLTKGPVGWLLPVLTVLGFLAWERRLGDARPLFPIHGLLLSVVPGVAWISAAISLAPSGFADEAVTTNLIGRFFAGTSHERPFYYYLYQFPVDFLPWTLVFPWVFWAWRRRAFASPEAAPDAASAWRFLSAWVLASLVFFSISSGKRGLYMVPAFPAAALLCADAVRLWALRHGRLPKGLVVAMAVLAGLLGVTGLLAIGVGLAPPFLPEGLAQFAAAVHAERLVAFGVCVVLCVGLGSAAFARSAPVAEMPLRRFWIAVAGAFGINACVFAFLLPALDPIRSPRPIAEAAAALTPEGGRIGLYRESPMIGGIRYYGGRPVAHLETPEQVAEFVAGGGQAIVVKSRKLERLNAITPVRAAARIRPGSRQVVVAVPDAPPVARDASAQ